MTNRKMEKKLRQAFARLTPAQPGSEQTQTLHTTPQSRDSEMPMQLPKSRLTFPTVAAVAAILAVIIFVGGTMLFRPSVSSGNNQPNITPPNSAQPDLLSDELKQEINNAWEETYGSTLAWDEPDYGTRCYCARYYGTYGDGFVAIFLTDPNELAVTGKESVSSYKFFYSSPFQLLIYRDGVFVSPEDACFQGMITKDDIATIASWHMMNPSTPDWAIELMKTANSPTTPPDGKLDRDTAIEKALAYAGLTKDQALITVTEESDRYNITLTTDTKEYYLEIGMYDGGGLHDFDVKYFDPDDYNPDATEGPNLPPPTNPATSLFDEEKALSCALKYASWKLELDDQLTKDDLTDYQVVYDGEDKRYDVVLALEDRKYCFEIDGNTGYAISVEVNYDVVDHDIGFWMYTKPEAIDIALNDRGVSESDITHLACYETEGFYYVVSFIFDKWEYVYSISGRTGSILSIEADSEYVLYG